MTAFLDSNDEKLPYGSFSFVSGSGQVAILLEPPLELVGDLELDLLGG